MDRNAGGTRSHARNKSKDWNQPRDVRDHRKDGRGWEESQRLIQDGNGQERGRSRSPRRKGERRNPNRRASPNRRVSWHDSVDTDEARPRGQSPEGYRRGSSPQGQRRGRSPVSRRKGGSPEGQRRGRDNSPRRDRKGSPQRGRKNAPQLELQNQRQEFQLAEVHSSHQSRRDMAQLEKSVGRPKRRRRSGSRSRSRSRSRSSSRSRSRSPNKQQNKSPTKKSNFKPKLRTTDPRILDAETGSARLSVLSIFLHIVAIGTSLMVIVPLSLLTSRWQIIRRACPIYVHNNIGVTVDWGNPNMIVCNILAYLPIVILTLSTCLVLFHYGIMHTWYTNKVPPKFALTRKYAVSTMLLTFVEAVVAWCIACMLTDGFRQTCLSFQLTPYPEDRPISCQYGFDDRDETYMFPDLNTFKKLMVALFGSWSCAIATTLLFISSLVRACCCITI